MGKNIQELKIKLKRQIEDLSEENLHALDLYMDFLLKQKESDSWDEDEFLKKLEQKRRNGRTKFL